MRDCLGTCASHAGLVWSGSKLHCFCQLGSLQVHVTPLPEAHVIEAHIMATVTVVINYSHCEVGLQWLAQDSRQTEYALKTNAAYVHGCCSC